MKVRKGSSRRGTDGVRGARGAARGGLRGAVRGGVHGGLRGVAVGIAAGVAVVLAGGCSGGAEPSGAGTASTPATSGSPSSSAGLPSVSPSLSSTPTGLTEGTGGASPTPTVSVSIPAAAQANTEAGAVEFAKFFLIAGSQAFVDGDTTALETLADPTCTTCDEILTSANEYKTAGHKTAIRSYVPGPHQVGPGKTNGEYLVDILGTERATAVVDKATGKVVDQLSEERSDLRITVRRTSASWRIVQVEAIVR